ncbi:MAG: TldD/PmbA family protein, partial [Candidatus Hermodarchaeota archaeon]
MNIEELKTVATMAMELGEKQKADELEVYVNYEKETIINIENGRISGTEQLIDVGLGIRIVFGKKIGTGFTTDFSKDAIKKTVIDVCKTAKNSADDENWMGLPPKSGTATKEQLFFPSLLEVPTEEVAEIASDLLKGCQIEGVSDPIIPVVGVSLLAFGSSVIINTHGLEAVDQASFFVSYLDVLALKEGKPGPDEFDVFISRKKVLDSPADFASDIAKRAYALADAKKVKLPKSVPVVFHPFGLSSIAEFIFLPSIRADIKQQGNSILIDRLGEQLVPADFEMYDDGTLPNCTNSSYYDAEGIAKQKTPLFEKGIFKNFVYDYTTAQKDETESTGNAQRTDETYVNPGSYANSPKVRTSNWVIKPGKEDFDSLISDIKLGLLIGRVQGAHQGSPESGEYTGVINPGWIIRYGEKAEPVVGLGVAG